MDPAAILGFFKQLATGVALPLGTAALLGGALGWERESWKKPAGLRTHMMVALGAATFTRLTLDLVAELGSSVDPSRIIQGVATGIGFLGAGTIIQSSQKVRGITTAAGVWVVGAIGACCGAGEYGTAAVAVVFSLVILALLTRIGPEREQDREAEEPESEAA